MYLAPGTYTIVVVADGFITSSKKITVAYDTDYTEDFTLAPTEMGIITIELTLPSKWRYSHNRVPADLAQ